MSLHQLNSKTNDLVLLLKTIWRYWNCSLSPVATDGMDGNGFNFFKFWCSVFERSSRKLLWLALSDKIHLISSSYSFTDAFWLFKVTLLHRYVVSSDFDATISSQCCCYGGIMLYSLSTRFHEVYRSKPEHQNEWIRLNLKSEN